MELNFLDIVLVGYFNHNEHLDLYFFRKWKEAEKLFYSKVEFYKGCINITDAVEQDINRHIHKQKKEIYDYLGAIKSGTIIRDPTGLTDEEVIAEFQSRLKQLEDKNGISCSLRDSMKNFQANLDYSDITYIRKMLLSAIKMDEPQQEVSEDLQLFRKIAYKDANLLFDEIKNCGCILDGDREAFLELFSSGKLPSESKKIVWRKNKQSLREMLIPLRANGVTIIYIQENAEKCFLHGLKKARRPVPMGKLPNNRLKDTDTDSYKVIEIMEKLAMR